MKFYFEIKPEKIERELGYETSQNGREGATLEQISQWLEDNAFQLQRDCAGGLASDFMVDELLPQIKSEMAAGYGVFEPEEIPICKTVVKKIKGTIRRE